MNKVLMLYLAALCILISASACAPREIVTQNNVDNSIGTIKLVSDTVHHNQNRVIETHDLIRNDSLRLFNGGEGLLDFGSDLRLRIFNDTEIGGIRTANDPGSPLDVKMTLFAGGFSGKLFREGSKAVFETPNDARIHIFATTFIIAYDRNTRETLIVNFEGDVRVESAGSQLISIRSGEIYQVQAGGEPVLWGEVPWTPGKYEERARSLQSALIPFDSVLPLTGQTAPEPTATPTLTTLLIESLTPVPSSTNTPLPSPTYTPTSTDTRTHTPTLTATPCPMLGLKRFDAEVDSVTFERFVFWSTVGGCGPYSGTLTARYESESAPYDTFQITSRSGTYFDIPPSRCEGTFNIVYTLTVKDGTGQEISANTSLEIIWIC